MELELKKFYEQQISQYKDLRPVFGQYRKILKKILTNIAEGCSSEYVIESRTKPISSFANKISRPDKSYTNPISEITDLCGLRVILPNFDELNTFCEVLKESFIISEEKREESLEDMQILDFWFGSKVFIVRLLPELLLYNRLNLKIPDEIYDLKAEIQVRTFLSHGWAANQYNIINKSGFKVPNAYKLELSRVAALLEIADNALNDLTKKMRNYESVYGAYMTPEKIKNEIERLEIVYATDKSNIDIAHRIAKLAITTNDLDKALKILYDIIKTDEWKQAPDLKMSYILRDLGISNYMKYKNKPHSDDYARGQSHLKTACERNPKDSDACTTLAGSYRKQNKNDKALEYYKKALEFNPGDPYPLGNYLILMIQQRNDLLYVESNREMIQKGIEKRLRQIEVMVDIPWAFFDVGLFNLFLGNIFESLDYYLKAIRFSQDAWMIETTFNTLEGLKNVHDKIEGIELVRSLLLLGMLFHPKSNEKTVKDATKLLSTILAQKEKYEEDSIVIVAGGTDEKVEKQIQDYKQNLIDGFREFSGIIISGGTKSGISRIVGDIQKEYPESLKTIGYIPSHLPSSVELDKRYSTIHTTHGKDFSVLEALQYWYDIFEAGIDPNKVKLIGINGGKIAEFEFHLAIALGAQVGIVDNSGRAASQLINDPDWTKIEEDAVESKRLRLFKVLKNTEEDIYNFLTKPFIIDPDIENIQKILIQHRESGMNIFELSFIVEDIDNSIFSGFLTALDHIATQELGVGDILSINFKEGYLLGGLFSDNSFKVVFLLNESPSKRLEDKLVKFINKIEEKLGKCFDYLYEACRVYTGGKKMTDLLSTVFGSEILKLLDKALGYDSEELPPVCRD